MNNSNGQLEPNNHDVVNQLRDELSLVKARLAEVMDENAKIREFYELRLNDAQKEIVSLREFVEKSNNASCSTSQEARRKQPRSCAQANVSLGTNLFNKGNISNDPSKQNDSNISRDNNLFNKKVLNKPSKQNVSNHVGNQSLEKNHIKHNAPIAEIITGPSSVSNHRNKKKIIQVVDANIGSVLQTIKSKNCVGFTLKQANVKSAVKITIDKPEEIPVIRDALKANSINFHEFKWECEKQLGYIIRGLTGVTEEDVPDVFDELKKAGIPPTADLSLLKTGYMRANPGIAHNFLLKLVLPPNFDIQVLKNIRYIDHVAVTIEKMKSKPVLQCLNCQRFGHSAAGCHHAHRCVKCGANHLRDHCARTLDKSIKLVCCNCGGEHTANNLTNCSYFINNVQSKKAEAISVKRTPATHKNFGASYADVVLTSTRSSYNSSPTDYPDLSKKMDRILQLVLKHDAVLQRLASNE